MALIQVQNLQKCYQMGSEELHVLRGVDMKIEKGEWVCILGSSGSGKSTLLHLMGGLDTPDEGEVVFNGQALYEMRAKRRDQFRNRHVGFVFQFYHLLPELNVVENTLVAGMVMHSILSWGGVKQDLVERSKALLEELGLGHRLGHRPNELSGGERQRVAIARALINRPDVLLADEPTGNLDQKTGGTILELFEKLHQEGQTIVMVTHDLEVAKRADRVLKLELGKLVKES